MYAHYILHILQYIRVGDAFFPGRDSEAAPGKPPGFFPCMQLFQVRRAWMSKSGILNQSSPSEILVLLCFRKPPTNLVLVSLFGVYGRRPCNNISSPPARFRLDLCRAVSVIMVIMSGPCKLLCAPCDAILCCKLPIWMYALAHPPTGRNFFYDEKKPTWKPKKKRERKKGRPLIPVLLLFPVCLAQAIEKIATAR